MDMSVMKSNARLLGFANTRAYKEHIRKTEGRTRYERAAWRWEQSIGHAAVDSMAKRRHG